MKKIEKNHNINDLDSPGEELDFILWKAELNKELSLFWKLMSD